MDKEKVDKFSDENLSTYLVTHGRNRYHCIWGGCLGGFELLPLFELLCYHV